MHVAVAADAALRDDHPLPGLGDVRDEQSRRRVVDLGAKRHVDHEVLAALAEHLLPLPGAAVLREALRVVVEREQRVDVLGGAEHDVPAATAVAAVRPAERHKRLAAERHRAVAAPAGADEHLNLVDKRL